MAKNKAVPQGVGRPVKLFDRDITKDRRLSKFHLDREAEQQADIFGYWSDLKAPARKQLENAELELEILSGEKFKYYKDVLDGGVDSKGIKKFPTDTMVNNAVSIDEDIIALKRDAITKREYFGLVESAIKQMDMRRSGIKILESLNHDNYFEIQGKSADEYETRERNKSKVKDAKTQVGKGLAKLDIPEEKKLVVEEEIIHSEPEEEVEEIDEVDDPDPSEVEEPDPSEVEESEETETEQEDEYDEDGTPDDDDDSPEEEEPVVEKPKRVSAEENKCPFGKVFGNYGHYDECDECDMEGMCFRESKKQ
ncbi:MAG: hypothetical protein PF518_04755 [Spirochaetaceae bacterium]|jgi:hypothetical protein|nr:hypothetical protein [Spirochaetaceae bacterium]